MHVYLAGAVLESVAGLVSVSTIVPRCAASGVVGKYKEPRCPQAVKKLIVAPANTTVLSKRFAILLPWLE
jgi:ABC-type antimicrobial peptide transport system ATPase subunit